MRRKIRPHNRVASQPWWLAVGALTIAVSMCLPARPARAVNSPDQVKNYTIQTFMDWLKTYKDAKPDFKPGDVLTAADLDTKIKPFMWPGYIEFLNFPEFKMKIGPYVDHTPRKDFLDCTEKYQSQVRLNADHTLANYVCGQPFPNSAIREDDPDAGWKAVWNYEWRWQNYGLFTMAPVSLMRFGGHHDIPTWSLPPTDWLQNAGVKDVNITLPSADVMKQIYGGGGDFERTMAAMYRKVFFTHLAQLENHTLPVPDANIFEFKEFTGFYTPFDIRGTAFIVYRYADPHREDDGWAYIPTLRRVRRISAQVKSDSLLGTDHTIADFYGFSGRELSWNWKFLGWKKYLALQDSEHEYTYLYGPNGIIPDDVWSMRNFAMVERTPVEARNPYSAVIDSWDSQNWDTFLMEAWDRGGKLWKVWEFQKKWSETFKGDWQEPINKGAFSTEFQSIQVIDVQNNRGTIWIVPGGFPNVAGPEATKIFDASNLEEIHR